MNNFKYKINGIQYEVEIQSIEGNIAKVEVNGKTYEVEIDREIKQMTPQVRSTKIKTTESTPAARTNKPIEHKGESQIKSPLPGVILDVFVKEGDRVKEGQKLMTLEAMKMENNIDCNKNGVVKSVNKAKGDSVMEGDILIIIGD